MIKCIRFLQNYNIQNALSKIKTVFLRSKKQLIIKKTSYETKNMPNKDAKSPVYQNLEQKLKAQFDKKPKLYWIGIGKTDFLYQANKDYRKLLDEKGYKYTYRESDGGHIWRNWRIYLSEFTPLLFK